MMDVRVFAVFENISSEIKKHLIGARKNVRICVAWISIEEYGYIIEGLVKRNVKVEIICNDEERHREGFGTLPSCVEVYYIRPKRSGAFMHNKFCIVDDNLVINGSYNWSENAKNSFENIVITQNSFNLTKSFLHEFYDLIEFDRNYPTEVCMYCRSHTFKLGIFGEESGKYNDSIVSVWTICRQNYHVQMEAEHHTHYIQSKFWPSVSDFYDENITNSSESMLDEFRTERNHERSLSEYFLKNSKITVDAIGSVSILNEMEHLEWGHEQEYAISMMWRSVHRRKIIPLILSEDDGDIVKIISHHRLV